MLSQFIGAILISLLHGLIPSHWLPVVAIGKKQGWNETKVLKVALYAACAHALSTVIIGTFLALMGSYLGSSIEGFARVAPAIILTALGIWFIYRHYTHHHFHLDPHGRQHKNIIWPILLAMFLSPCMEIEGYFFVIGAQKIEWLLLLSAIYFILSVASIFLWVLLAWKGAQRINAHRWEHWSGIITGVVLIASGILFLFT
jgi:nickel/cobalt transporter (NicO) family protein